METAAWSFNQLLGGAVQPYWSFGQQFAFAGSDGTLQQSGGCASDTTTDPLGAAFDQVYNGKSYCVIWNDPFYPDPLKTLGDAPLAFAGSLMSSFGGRNQQGTLSGPHCNSSQNGRGGLFFVIQNIHLFKSVRDLLQG